MAVILMCGPSGAGKTTHARRLEESGWIRLSFDGELWRRGATGLEASHDVLDAVEDELTHRLLEAVDRGDDVVLDYSFATRSMRDDYRALVAGHGVVAETVFLDVDRETALRRVGSRRGTGPDDLRLTDAQVVAHVDGFERPTFAEHPLRVVDGDLEFRHARLDDIDALLRFWAEAAENAARPADDARSVEQLLGRDPAAVIVAEQDGRPVASIVAGWDGWRAHLYRLAVHPGARGRGVGRRVLAHAERRLEALGATRLCAMVLDENDPGAGLWRAAGYAPQGEWSRWVKPVTSR